MRKKVIAIILILGVAWLGYDYLIKDVSGIDVFNGNYYSDIKIVNYTEDELMNRIIYVLSNQNEDKVTRINKLPYAVEFTLAESPFKVTHVSKNNKELDNEVDKPFIRIEQLEGRSKWKENENMENDAIKLLNILAPSLSKFQLNQVINDKVDFSTRSTELDDLVEFEYSRYSENKYLGITKEYGDFIDDSENPLTEDKQPDQLFSLNYKQGKYKNYTSDIWMNQLVSELSDVFEWEITVDEVYKSNSTSPEHMTELFLLPDELNDGYTEYLEITTSNNYSSTEKELTVPSVRMYLKRVWQTEEERYDLFASMVEFLEDTLSDKEIEEMYIELDSQGSYDRIEKGAFILSMYNNSIDIQKNYTEEISSGSLYNLAGKNLWKNSEESIYDELIAIENANYPNRYFEETLKNSSSYSASSSTTSNNSTSTSSSTNTTSSSLSDEVSSTIQTGIVTVVKNTVRETEGFSGIDWPWSFEDFNIKSLGGDMYTTQGNFTHNGYVYNFELIIMMRPDTSGRIEYYNVY